MQDFNQAPEGSLREQMKQSIIKTFRRLHVAFGERPNSAARAQASDTSKAVHSRGPVLCIACVGASVEAVSASVERSPIMAKCPSCRIKATIKAAYKGNYLVYGTI